MKNNNFSRSRLAAKLALYVVLASTFITIFTSAFQLYEEYTLGVSSIEMRLNEIRDSSLDTVSSRVWVADLAEINKTVSGIVSLPDIENVKVYEGEELVAEVGQFTKSDIIERSFPLTYTFQGERREIGHIYIAATLENVYQHLISQALTIIVSNGIKTFLVSGFILFIFYNLVARHLHKIAEYARNLDINNMEQRLVLNRDKKDSAHQDEFDVLTDALHYMQSNLAESVIKVSKSEQNLSQTLNSIGDAVIATDTNGIVMRMNPVAESLTGWTNDEAKGSSLNKIFPIINALTRKSIISPVEQVLKSGKIVGLANHTILLARDGREYQISDSAAPIKDENNEIRGVILVFRDVTKEYLLQESVKSNERRLQAIMNNSSSVIYVKDLVGKFTLVNRQFEKLVGLPNAEIIGKTTHDLFPEKIAKEMVANDKDVLNSRFPKHSEEKVLQDDGMHIYSSAKFCLQDENAIPYAIGGISTDITDSVKQNKLLRQSQKMDALGKLTGGVAHDFNNMLNVIIGYSEILIRNLEKESPNAHFAEEIKNAGQRGAVLTRKLLSFSGQGSHEKTTVNINTVLADDINMLSKTMTARIYASLKLDDELWATILDKGELEDVILNISINAMHAMPRGGKITYFTLNESLDALAADKIGLPPGDYVRLSIVDTGFGISPETINQIFDPFFTTKGEHGTGLGLSQVYGFMERCNGTVTVDSAVGNGTEFSLYFPRALADETSNTKSKDHHSDKPVLSGTEVILLVDDEKSLLELARNILTQQGYTVYCAENADAALWILSRNKVDMMLSDVIMPGTSGFELALQVEKLYPNIKIKLASGYAGEHIDMDKDSPYMKKLLDKPYTSTKLLQSVRELLEAPN